VLDNFFHTRISLAIIIGINPWPGGLVLSWLLHAIPKESRIWSKKEFWYRYMSVSHEIDVMDQEAQVFRGLRLGP
jgi:hypothetical protein